MPIKESRILFLLAAINFTHILDFMIMMPLGNYLIPSFGLSASQFTILVSAYAFSAGISSFLAAFYANKYDRKQILIRGYLGFLIGTLACGLAPSYEWLLLARVTAGVFGGLLAAQVISIIADLIPFERRGKAMGRVMAAFAVSSTLGVPFALYLANLISWHAPFILVAVLGLALLPFLHKDLPSMTGHLTQQDPPSSTQVIKQVFANVNQRRALLFSGLMFMGHFMIIPFINPFLEFNKGFDKQHTPLVYLFGGICAFFAANIIGALSDKYGKWRTYIICLLLSLPLVVLITHLPDMHIAWVVFIFCLWFTVATGRGVTASTLISNVVEPQFRGSFQSFNSFMQQMGTGLASLVAGWVVIKNNDGSLLHYPALGYFSIVILLATLLAGYRVFGKKSEIGG
ncbi:MAG TPA: MFS transporter [Saprospiraceae bacterium]|nr:MFS transporter [Saprospiraceae bacterium]